MTGYDKRTMANDIRGLMAHLGESRATVIGHDRGARSPPGSRKITRRQSTVSP
jgi:hypothetical protein